MMVSSGESSRLSNSYKSVQFSFVYHVKGQKTKANESYDANKEINIVEEWTIITSLLSLFSVHVCAYVIILVLSGKTVLPVLQLVRIVLVGAAVQPVWSNDYFVCNTLQPGCSSPAYNAVFPFSVHRYWTLQVIRHMPWVLSSWIKPS